MEVRSRESIIALSATILLHLFLLLIFLLVKIDWNPKLETFTEIAFLSGNAAESPAANNTFTLPPSTSDSESDAQEKVSLPERKMLEQEDLTIPAPKEKFAANDRLDVPEPTWTEQPTDLPNESSVPMLPDKEIPSPSEKFSLDDKALPSTGPIKLPGEQSKMPFTIEGEAAHRTVVYKILPTYPEGLQKTATIRVQFTVLPDGTVGEMIPLIKSDPYLERITLNSLKQWRFNPLPANQPQQAEIGIITFRYLLK